MNRRNFLGSASLGVLPAVSGGLGALSFIPVPDRIKPDRIGNDPETAAGDFALHEMSIDTLQQKLQSGEYTSKAITKMYLRHIAQIDKHGPALNAVIELNPDALAIAAGMDDERKAGKVRGPLHGIPVLIKDNINTGDAMMTTAGSLALEGHKADKDAFIVQRLREAGAVILGKTNLSEWANFRSSRSTSGWSSRGGQTKNPYILARNPSGSSAGSGSAVAASLCAVAVGTETNGSIVSPSSINGIVGIKPTVGLLSRSGIIPISATQDTPGPIARTVKDAAILLGAMTGVDPADAVTAESKGKSMQDYTTFLDPRGLQGRRIGVDKSYMNSHEGIVALFHQAIELMKAQGATIIEVGLVKQLSEVTSGAFTVLQYEFRDGLNRYLSTANAGVKTLADVIAFNRQYEARAMPYFKQETLESSETKSGLDNEEYKAALQKLLTSRKIIDDILHQDQLDAISAPTNGLACYIDLINGDYRTGTSFSTPAAISGYPHITVPMGLVMGLPAGISFMGSAYKEPELLRIAYAFEQASGKREAPRFLKG